MEFMERGGMAVRSCTWGAVGGGFGFLKFLGNSATYLRALVCSGLSVIPISMGTGHRLLAVSARLLGLTHLPQRVHSQPASRLARVWLGRERATP